MPGKNNPHRDVLLGTKEEMVGNVEKMRQKMGRYVFISIAIHQFRARVVGIEYS